MSDQRVLAAVTETLKRVLFNGLFGANVAIKARSPDKFSGKLNDNFLNLFLYQVVGNGALANQNLPGRTKPGETGFPPLALDLYYLLTAYPSDDDGPDAQELLASGMTIFYDHPVLEKPFLQQPGDVPYPFSEQIRITRQPLSVEDLFRLWSTFQTPYRLSVAYLVSVVLLESTRPTRAPLPVLQRRGGPQDTSKRTDPGPLAQGSLIPPFPSLTGIDLAEPEDSPKRLLRHKDQPIFEPEESIRLEGYHLSGSVSVLIRHSLSPNPLPSIRPEASSNDMAIEVKLPPAPELPAGVYSIVAELALDGPNKPKRSTNDLPLMVAPVLGTIPGPVKQGEVLTLPCKTLLRKGQRVALLLGSREVPAETFNDNAVKVDFIIPKDVVPATYPIRLRVDGVDTFPTLDNNNQPSFDKMIKVVSS